MRKGMAAGSQGFHIEHGAEQRSLIQSLGAAQTILQKAGNSYSVLPPAGRALGRIARAIRRPLRIAILGESNSGKSTLANLIIGEVTLPALPAANTRLPTLLRYAPSPFAAALYASGDRFVLSANGGTPPGVILRLEVGLPGAILRLVELLDFPGSANPLFPISPAAVVQHGIDAAIWATVATQAWRETERAAWLGLPQRIRLRGLLAVTHLDLVQTEGDFLKLRARLKSVARPHFLDMCFVAAPGANRPVPAEAAGMDSLSAQVLRLAQQFLDERLGKAVLVTRHVAARTLDRLDAGATL